MQKISTPAILFTTKTAAEDAEHFSVNTPPEGFFSGGFTYFSIIKANFCEFIQIFLKNVDFFFFFFVI